MECGSVTACCACSLPRPLHASRSLTFFLLPYLLSLSLSLSLARSRARALSLALAGAGRTGDTLLQVPEQCHPVDAIARGHDDRRGRPSHGPRRDPELRHAPPHANVCASYRVRAGGQPCGPSVKARACSFAVSQLWQCCCVPAALVMRAMGVIGRGGVVMEGEREGERERESVCVCVCARWCEGR